MFLAQPPMVQRFLETQARDLAEALVQRQPQVKFKLPDKVITEVAAGEKAKAGASCLQTSASSWQAGWWGG